MSGRPTLKLKLGSLSKVPTQQTPQTPSAATPRIKLKLGSLGSPAASQASPPPPSAAEVAPAVSKPKSAKKAKKDKAPSTSTPKKRNFDASNASEDDGNGASISVHRPQIKKLKFTTSARPPPSNISPLTPFLRLKAKGKPPVRPLGVGYDSEASDREEDPAIEEEFILRMKPGEDCEYLRKAVEEKQWGPRRQGGADVRLKFLTRDGRRAVVTIQGRHYAATMVDLPCIVEGMKSWDRRGWYKTADICQMLLVLGRVEREDQAMTMALPEREVDKSTWAFAHGLTPPMRWVRRRRFRKRINHRTIEAVEEEVERLFKLDEECEESRFEVLDLERQLREESARLRQESEDVYDSYEQDGEVDAEGNEENRDGYTEEVEVEVDEGDETLEADLEMAMMMGEAENEAATIPGSALASNTAVVTPAESGGATTSEAATPSKDDSGDESSDEDAAEDVDEDELEQQQDMQRQREEIADLEGAIKSQIAEHDKLQNGILKKKVMTKIQSLRTDLELKKAAIGEGADE